MREVDEEKVGEESGDEGGIKERTIRVTEAK